MLTKRDFRYNFFLLRIASVLKILPGDFDWENGILKVPQSQWKRRISLGYFTIAMIHGCYINLRLLQVLLYSHNVVRHHLLFHVDLSLASLMVGGWYLACFVLYPETFVALYNEIFAVSGVLDSEGALVPREPRSRQEWLALAMPIIIVVAIVFVLWIFTYDRRMAFLVFSILPESYQMPLWFWILFCEEVLFLSFLASNASIVLNTQLLFFEKITGSLKRLKYLAVLQSRYADETADTAYDQLRKMQLQVNLFNNINRFIAFSFKIFCITMCTLNGYFMIAHFSADPIFGSVYYVVFWILCMLYSIMYERAFAIPKMVRVAKSAVLLTAGTKICGPGCKRIVEMRLRSVPAMGIQVGHFHSFERVATPVFVDYVLRNVTGLLVMHLKK